MTKVGRNDPCPCGTGRKYKRCCWEKDEAQAREVRAAANAELQKRAESIRELFALEEERGELALGVDAMMTLAKRGQIDQAYRVGRDLLMHQKGGHEGYDNLARGCVERGELQEAIQWYVRGLEAVVAHPEDYRPTTAKRYRMLIQMLGGRAVDSDSAPELQTASARAERGQTA